MISEALQRPIGPLAAWQWGLVIGGGYLGYRVLTGKGLFPSGGGSTPSGVTTGGAAIGDPGFTSGGSQGPAGPAGPPGPAGTPGTVTTPPSGPHGIHGGPGGIWSKPPIAPISTGPKQRPPNAPKTIHPSKRLIPISNPLAPPVGTRLINPHTSPVLTVPVGVSRTANKAL